METSADTNGLLILVIGFLIRYAIGWRRFKRRNGAGLQVFSSYLPAVIIPILESVFKVFGLLLILFGAFSILISL